MAIGFKELFASCERTTDLLKQVLPAGGRQSVLERVRAAESLVPLLADLGDFADDHDIDDGLLCDVRAYLALLPDAWAGPAFCRAVAAAAARVDRIETAIHVEGQRRLRAALIGV